MKLVVIRLLVVMVMVVGIGWLVLKFVDFPGDYKSLGELYENHLEKCCSVVTETVDAISHYENCEVNVLLENKSSYEAKISTIQNLFIEGKVNNFTWQNEKKLKSSLDNFFKIDNDLKDYILSVTLAKEAEPNDNTIQNMIDKLVEKFEGAISQLDELNKEVKSFLIETETAKI